ncbi:MAG: alpha/beta hydrolase-fold protein [Acidobacteria bacterium]|nr:alpha/beta hydrolase-fold protein [Acidobacteriota bacterium]
MDRFLITLMGASILAACAFGAPRLQSPEVHPDLRVTFRFVAPAATSVALELETEPRTALHKGDGGVWSVTVGPLAPDLYTYSFLIDGASVMDPLNPRIQPNLLESASLLHVPGPATLDWEVKPVPRGVVHRHEYRSGVVGDDRDFYVYTPPNYDPSAARRYPVLYLLHGYSDDSSAWTAGGQVHVILDNLIAAGKAQPMLVVMPNGYGVPEIVLGPNPLWNDDAVRQRSYDKFREALFTEVMPQVEHAYRVSANREARAIAGLSMGGGESLYTGLNALDRFAWIGAFSSGGIKDKFDQYYPKLDASANDRLRLLWIACGTSDGLINLNRQLKAWLKAKNVRFTDVETPGDHNWRVWRRNLSMFLPLLFRK